MYAFVLLTHSWLRYAVLGMGLWLIACSARGVRSRSEWSPSDERVHVRFLAVLDTQFLLGLLLYVFLSPISHAAFADLGAAMKIAPLRFFGVEHIATMFIAIAVAHIGRTRSKSKPPAQRHRTVLFAQALWLVLTLLAIPWPMLDIGRPLFRM